MLAEASVLSKQLYNVYNSLSYTLFINKRNM